MADSAEEIQKSIKKYLVIGTALIVLTCVTVGLSFVELPTHGLNILVGMILAAFKSSLVLLIFMHLNHEPNTIYKILAFTVVFALVIFIITFYTHADPLIFEGFDSTSAALKH